METIRPKIGEIPVPPTARDVFGDAAEAFDQSEPQHDRQGPQLAQRERTDRLVGGHKMTHLLDIDVPVGVGDQFEGDGVDPGETRFRTVEEARQFATVGPWQIEARRANLLLDDVKIVEEPLSRRRDVSRFVFSADDEIVGLDELLFVLIEATKEAVRAPLRIETMFPRHRHRVPMQLFAAEQNIADRGLGSFGGSTPGAISFSAQKFENHGCRFFPRSIRRHSGASGPLGESAATADLFA